ncbi:MAG: hypothetical protein EBQ87_13510 [Planctomycetes bacterium]|nr:hypothetical protein [Planctomycetota bacterium]
MSTNKDNPFPEESKKSNTLMVSIVAGITLFAGILLYFTFSSNPVKKDPDKNNASSTPEDSSLKSAQELLTNDNDLISCKNALQQINNHLATHPNEKPATFSPEKKDVYSKFGMNDQQFNEIDSPTFTLLDPHYLEERLMFRDIARFLEPPVMGVKQVKASISEVSTQAFMWVVREMRLTPRSKTNIGVPPIYALRRGWGSSYERSLAFLLLLEQFLYVGEKLEQPVGCLLLLPSKDTNTPPRLWVGVVDETGNDLYLFDPILGLPLPGGKDGKPLLLTELKADPKKIRVLDSDQAPYDVQPDQISKMAPAIAPSLSSLAPRMKLLEEKYLPTGAKARLSSDLESLITKIEKACRPSFGPSAKVLLMVEAVESLRMFLTSNNGGFASPQVFQVYQTELIPQTAIPQQLQKVPHPLILENLGNMLSRPFINSALEPKLPRDQMLHARYAKAVPDLVREGDELRIQLRGAETDPNLPKRINNWMDAAKQVFTNFDTIMQNKDRTQDDLAKINLEIRSLFQKGEKDLLMMIAGSIGRPRGEQISWLLALCKHELAEQQQRRFDIQSKSSTPTTLAQQDRLNKWKDCESAWRRYLEEFPLGAGAPHGKLLWGYALANIGDKEAAINAWQDVSRPMAIQEKAARLFLAKSLKDKK